MTTHGKVPGWIQRRISERPVARWIAWNAGRPREVETEAVMHVPPPANVASYGGNVVHLFKRSA